MWVRCAIQSGPGPGLEGCASIWYGSVPIWSLFDTRGCTQFTAILILAEGGTGGKVSAQPRNVSDTDSRSLATLLLLRQIQVSF